MDIDQHKFVIGCIRLDMFNFRWALKIGEKTTLHIAVFWHTTHAELLTAQPRLPNRRHMRLLSRLCPIRVGVMRISGAEKDHKSVLGAFRGENDA